MLTVLTISLQERTDFHGYFIVRYSHFRWIVFIGVILYLKSFIDGLLNDPHGEVAGDAPDVHLLGEGSTSRQIVRTGQKKIKKLARLQRRNGKFL